MQYREVSDDRTIREADDYLRDRRRPPLLVVHRLCAHHVSLTARFASEHPHWTLAEHYMVGIPTSLLFFVSILVHELAHSFVALAKGIPVRSVTLFVFGGVAQIGRGPDRPMPEFQIAIAGPIASALLAVGFGTVEYFAGDQLERLWALAGWLSSINLMLALFNLVP